MKVDQAIGRLYPYKTFLSKDGQTMVHDLMDNLSFHRSSDTIDKRDLDDQTEMSASTYVRNDYHDSVIQQLNESMRVHDLCLIGPRGSGKSTLIAQLAKNLSLDIEPIMLYQVLLFIFLFPFFLFLISFFLILVRFFIAQYGLMNSILVVKKKKCVHFYCRI